MMYNNFSSFNGFGSLWYGFHGLICLLFLTGVILLIIWATKNLKKDQLLKWSIGLIVIAGLGWLLGISFGGLGFRNHMYGNGFGYGLPTQNMWECMQDDECHEEMETFMEQMMGLE